MTNFYIITIFPEAFDSYFKTSILGRAQKNKIIKINIVNLRDFANGKKSRSGSKKNSANEKLKLSGYRAVDDKPFGGGPGMVLKVEPIYNAVKFLNSRIKGQKSKTRIILFSTRGKKLDQKLVKKLSKYDNLILICGRYEGVDERVAKYIADEEISIGDFILSGGELPAMVLVEAVSRHIKGVLGKQESLEEIKGSYPVYTRPAVFKNWRVPKVLLSGDHQKIEKWRSLHQSKF
jgi:tRNA (guanine37-N1)-methyltransferase